MPKVTPGEGSTERPRCPACRVELRMRDDKGADPVFPCPECAVSLRRDRNDDGGLIVVLAEKPKKSTTAASSAPVRRRPATAPVTETSDRSLVMFGSSMILLTALISAWMIWGRSTPIEVSTDPVPDAHAAPVPETTPDLPAPVTVATRLADLATSIADDTREKGHFPTAADATSGLPPAQQFSWLARLEAHGPNAPAARKPVFGKPWNDPVNEPFVGRRIEGYLNPDIVTLVGDDGRPATHVAGVAGVGRDAVDLPAGHPRAGMFGTQRKTSSTDLKDGQANVVMVLGVEAQLGSWADPGRATVRPLTSPPYLHGPDGFGGGTGSTLPALMADGSVRMFAADTDPLLLRRLAAIADGFPLDLNIPGEPGDSLPTAAPPLRSVAEEDPDNPPVSALTAITEAQRPMIARPPVAPLLQQRLASFQQSKPTSRRQLLAIAEDLLGRPIIFDPEQLGPLADQLETKITFALEETTIAAVLEQVLSNTDLEIVISPQQAAIRKRTTGAMTAIRLEP